MQYVIARTDSEFVGGDALISVVLWRDDVGIVPYEF